KKPHCGRQGAFMRPLAAPLVGFRYSRVHSDRSHQQTGSATMAKEIIHTDAAPAAVGPYSQAVAVNSGRTIYLSGQIGLEPGTGELVSENFEGQVRQAFANMKAVIEAA